MNSPKNKRFGIWTPRLAAIGSALVAALAITTLPGLADTAYVETAESAAICDQVAFTQPFLPFGDQRDYYLAPGGAFENGAPGWTMTGGARVSWFSNAHGIHGQADKRSLLIPTRGSATTPLTCINLDFPHARMATANWGWNPELLVEVNYPDVNSGWVTVGRVTPNSGIAPLRGWKISDDLLLKPELAGAEQGKRRVLVRFTALKGTWWVDDLYVDPRRH